MDQERIGGHGRDREEEKRCDGRKLSEAGGCDPATLSSPGASVSLKVPGGSGSFSWSHRVDTQGEVACLSLGCDRKQEVPVISQDTLTLEREPAKTGGPPSWGGKVWPSVKNSWLPVRAVGLLKNRAVYTVGMPVHLKTHFLFPSLIVFV